MIKLDKKGFALAETLIVSSVVAGILIYLFVQFALLKRNYSASFRYNTINGLYALEDVYEYIDDLDNDVKQKDIIANINDNGYILIKKEDGKFVNTIDHDEEILLKVLGIEQLIITKGDLSNLTMTNFDGDMQNFISKMKNVKSNDYRLIAKFDDNTISNLVFKLEVS